MAREMNTRSPKQAVILAGGLGTRLRPITNQVPKPMVLVNGKPFLDYLLQQLAAVGIRRFLLLVGYLGDQIKDYFGDGVSRGWVIEYSHGPVEWDTGRRLWEAREYLDDYFFLLYSDNFAQFRIDKLQSLFSLRDYAICLSATPRIPGNALISDRGEVEVYDRTRSSPELNHVELGYMIVDKKTVFKVMERIPGHPNISFSNVLEELARQRQLAAVVLHDSYHSVSDPERLEKTSQYLSPKRLILLDRDGVINSKAARGEYITDWKNFEWVPETRAALRILGKRGFKFIVITNQAGVARGMIEPAKLDRIHAAMVEELKSDGVDILSVYMCPHHWDENCNCRKPAPGLFFAAARDFLIRLDQIIYAGDDIRDCIAARNAGCLGLLIGEQDFEHDSANGEPAYQADTLYDAIPWIEKLYSDWGAIDPS